MLGRRARTSKRTGNGLRIAVNAQLLSSGRNYRSAGVATYLRELVDRLPRAGPDHDFVIFVPPGTRGTALAPSRLPTSIPVVRIAWEQVIEAGALLRRGVELVHSPVNVSPILTRCPSVVTLHDLSFLKMPERFVKGRRWYQRALAGRSCRTARRVIVPSQATKEDAVAAFGLSPERVVVVPHGVDARFRPDKTLPRPLAAPYILYVGTLEPRKNVPRLLEAFARLKCLGFPHVLALVGAEGWMYKEVGASINRLAIEPFVHRAAYVENLVPWYNYADFLVYPSEYEGFGLPPLEAMACGAPVVLSSAGSLSEVGGDAAVFVEPSDVEGLTEAMRALIEDGARRERLSILGLERASHFSWEETARRTVEVYESAVRDG